MILFYTSVGFFFKHSLIRNMKRYQNLFFQKPTPSSKLILLKSISTFRSALAVSAWGPQIAGVRSITEVQLLLHSVASDGDTLACIWMHTHLQRKHQDLFSDPEVGTDACWSQTIRPAAMLKCKHEAAFRDDSNESSLRCYLEGSSGWGRIRGRVTQCMDVKPTMQAWSWSISTEMEDMSFRRTWTTENEWD